MTKSNFRISEVSNFRPKPSQTTEFWPAEYAAEDAATTPAAEYDGTNTAGVCNRRMQPANTAHDYRGRIPRHEDMPLGITLCSPLSRQSRRDAAMVGHKNGKQPINAVRYCRIRRIFVATQIDGRAMQYLTALHCLGWISRTHHRGIPIGIAVIVGYLW